MDVERYLAEKARIVEEEIDRWVQRGIKPEPLARAMRHLLEAGGKRLRPCLLMTACEAVGGKAGDVVEAAAAIELLHNFTLIHDDIMDRDEFRRNVKTVHVLWGEPLAIIAGDALFAKVFEALAANAAKLGLDGRRTAELFDIVSKASFEICRGQALDMLMAKREEVSEQEYFEMVAGKTGALIGASTKLGALLGGGTEKQAEALEEYGKLTGVAFQIQDDVLGIVGEPEKFGKPIGSDVREGKRTLLVVRALERASPGERALLLRALGNERASKADIERVIELMKRVGAVEHAREKARGLVEEAKSKLAVLPDSGAKRVLLELAGFVVEREF